MALAECLIAIVHAQGIVIPTRIITLDLSPTS
jgi:hypothetical protein